jgi:surfactin synthase thioesterase subunit/glycosyltransferase involved in cell wall biosynthesis
MEALAERGHEVRVVTRVERFGPEDHGRLVRELVNRGIHPESSGADAIRMLLNGVDVRVLTRSPNLRGYFSDQIADFDPDIIVTSTDDPAQLLFDLAVKAPGARVVYLVRATIAVPFGPESSKASTSKTAVLRAADGVVGVSQYVADYVRKWGGMDAIHVPISLVEKVTDYPNLASFDNSFVTMVNPCAVKGIGIFLELAGRMPDVAFAAVPTWGTTHEDIDALYARKNITVLRPFDNIDELFGITKVLLVPSVWAEARSRLLMEAMSRGVPVIASDIGGIREAHLGVDYLIPITPISHYLPAVDRNMVPVAEVPPQDVEPWERTLRKVLTDKRHYDELSARSRTAALEYVHNLNVLPFEAFLEDVRKRPKKGLPGTGLTDEKKKLLAFRLRQRAASAKPETAKWFSGLEDHAPGRLVLFCFPYAGGGTMLYRSWREQLEDVATVCALQLPGRESRIDETLIDDMDALVETLAREIRPHLHMPFSFFGHSMGAAIGFELARRLRANGAPAPRTLHVSAARAPQFRLGKHPAVDPSDQAFMEELKKLGGMPMEVLDSEKLLRLAMPALRADARLYRNYVYKPGEPIKTPIFAYGGAEDWNVQPEHLDAWCKQTTGGFRRREFPGGHFFIQTAPEFVKALSEDLR